MEFPVSVALKFKYQMKKNGHDFFDVPVDRDLGVRIPNFFTGVSGGWGLCWGRLLVQDPSMEEVKKRDYFFVGDAFLQRFCKFRVNFFFRRGPRSPFRNDLL